MKLTIKIIAVLILVALASPVFILNGCGKPINGGQCGSCPDSTAPFGSTIEAPTLTAPNATLGSCYPAISFVVLGPDNKRMSEVCVEIFTDGASVISTHTSSLPDCSDVVASAKTSMVTRTNSSGVISLAFITPATTAGQVFFVEAASCSITGIATTPPAE